MYMNMIADQHSRVPCGKGKKNSHDRAKGEKVVKKSHYSKRCL